MDDYNLIIGLSCMDLPRSESRAESIYLKVIKPFLRELYKYPEIKAVLHFSGTALEWIEDKHPEVIMLLEELVKKKKQVEILGGGYYEPVLPMLSPADRSGQLEALTTLLRKKFGKRPRGCWITGSIWDNSLILPVKNSGMDYVFLDYESLSPDSVRKRSCFKPFITEDNGKLINIFPVHRMSGTSETVTIKNQIAELKEKVRNPEEVISLIFSNTDIENKSEEWVEKLFLELSSDREIRTINPPIYLKNPVRLEKIYVQNRSNYKNVLSDNYEINLLYARMIHVQTLVNQIRGDKYKKKSAVEYLWASQNHVAYKENSSANPCCFQNESRRRIYSNLIDAELLTRQKGVFIPSLLKSDFDMDGFDEYLYQGDEYNLFLHTEGGTVFEIDNLRERWNYCDAIDYSDEKTTLMKSFSDFFLDSGCAAASAEEFLFADSTRAFKKDYTVSDFEREKKSVSFTLKIKEGEKGCSFKINKKYVFKRNRFEVLYSITNTGASAVSKKFGTGIFLSLNRACQGAGTVLRKEGRSVFMEDNSNTLSIMSEKEPFFITEDKYLDECYCYTTVMPVYEISNLEPGKTWENKIEFKI